MAMELSFWNDFLCRNALTANDPCGHGTVSLRWINRKSWSRSCKSNCNTSTKIKFVKAMKLTAKRFASPGGWGSTI